MQVPQQRGEPSSFSGDSIILKDGSKLEAELLIWATGYRTGASRLALHSSDETPATCEARSFGEATMPKGAHSAELLGGEATSEATLGGEGAPLMRDDGTTGDAGRDAGPGETFDLGADAPLFEHILPTRFPVPPPPRVWKGPPTPSLHSRPLNPAP